MENRDMQELNMQDKSQNSAPMGQLPYPPQPANPDTPHTKKSQYLPIDSIFAALSVLLGFLFIKSIPVTRHALGALLCLVSWYALGAFVLIKKKVGLQRRAVIYAAVMLILSLGLITGGNNTVRTLLFLGLMVSFFYWSYIATGLDGGHLFGNAPFSHLLRGVILLPATSIEHLCPALIAFRQKSKASQKALKTVGLIGIGLLIAILPTLIVVLLLSYDQQFMDILDRMFSFSFDRIWKNCWQLVLGFAFATLLFGTLFGTIERAERSKEKPQDLTPTNTHVVPKALLCAAATPLLLVYVIFFVSQWNYYVSAFTHRLPEGLTYATYAREGFFQLCVVCALNAILLLVFHLLIRKTEGRRMIERIYSIILSVFTLILIATAISKMILYISFYGLTQKRVYASWLMLLLAVIFLLSIVSQLKKGFKLFRAAALTCLLFAALITLPDVDGMIASYNVNAYLSGKLNTVDVASISDYGASSVPALIKLEQELTDDNSREDADAILQQTQSVLKKIEADLAEQPNSFFSFNLPDTRAKRLLRDRADPANR